MVRAGYFHVYCHLETIKVSVYKGLLTDDLETGFDPTFQSVRVPKPTFANHYWLWRLVF